jgi:hypothetical protein
MLVRQMLEEDQFAVFSTCEHWLRTVPTLEPDPDDPDDVDTEAEDHCFDCTKAGLMRRTSHAGRSRRAHRQRPDPGRLGGAGAGGRAHRVPQGAERRRA